MIVLRVICGFVCVFASLALAGAMVYFEHPWFGFGFLVVAAGSLPTLLDVKDRRAHPPRAPDSKHGLN